MMAGALTTDEDWDTGPQGLAQRPEIRPDGGIIGGEHDADPNGAGPEPFGGQADFLSRKVAK